MPPSLTHCRRFLKRVWFEYGARVWIVSCFFKFGLINLLYLFMVEYDDCDIVVRGLGFTMEV